MAESEGASDHAKGKEAAFGNRGLFFFRQEILLQKHRIAEAAARGSPHRDHIRMHSQEGSHAEDNTAFRAKSLDRV